MNIKKISIICKKWDGRTVCALAKVFKYQDVEGKSILSIALSRMSKGHANVAHQLPHIVATLPDGVYM